MLYPLTFNPVYKDYLWGGRGLSRFGKILPRNKKAAESWEISAHQNGLSVVRNGPLAGQSLQELVDLYGDELTGTLAAGSKTGRFPLLIKLIDASDRLSVQVHPDDNYAFTHEKGDSGKNEMWYVLHAEPGAKLIAGVKPGTTKDLFARSITQGNCLDYLNQIPVKSGDAINIPAGLVHAIGEGLIIYEVQQNSDTTYRVYDYDRTDTDGSKRELHIQQALDVIDFHADHKTACVPGITIRQGEDECHTRRVLVVNQYIKSEHWYLQGRIRIKGDRRRFTALTVLDGTGIVYSGDTGHKQVETRLAQGDSCLIPASLNSWEIEGKVSLIAATVSDFEQDLCELASLLEGQPEDLTDFKAKLSFFTGKIGLQPIPPVR